MRGAERRKVEEIDHGRDDVDELDRALDLCSGPHVAASTDQQRNVDGAFVEEDAVGDLPVLSQALAVISGHDEDGSVEQAVLSQPPEEIAQTGVDVRDLPRVPGSLELPLRALRRLVREVRVVVVNPEEEGARKLSQTSDGQLRHLLRPPLGVGKVSIRTHVYVEK